MRPPMGPTLIDQLFGLSFLTVRWYAVCILGGAVLASVVAARRAVARGENPDHVQNLLTWGLVVGVACARLYYVAFEWRRYAGQPLLAILNPQGGGLAIHGALIGAALLTVIYTRRHGLPLLRWLDICVPTVLIGQALGRWGNFFNEEAYGRPTTLPWGLDIPAAKRIAPFNDPANYPASTRFHPTFLYESLWNLGAFGLIIALEHRSGDRFKPGDSALLYGVLYSIGRFWIEGLRTDSLCVGAYTLDGSCVGGLRIAQLVSLAIAGVCALLLLIRHRRRPGGIVAPTTLVVGD
jgi:phosphatidylglycerol---prolipoprotein diacylglyceryl transferase